MEVPIRFLLFILLPSFLISIPLSAGQLAPAETRILFQVQKLLEYPDPLQSWTNWTNFCYLPSSPSLTVSCTNGHVTELTIVGNKTRYSSSSTLSKNFSIDSLFTDLTKLSTLKVLSLVSLGIWGPFPSKIGRLASLEVLNLSSNLVSGQIPRQVVLLQNLTSLVLSRNLLNGSVPDLTILPRLMELNLEGNHLGPEFPELGTSLVTVVLANNSMRSRITLDSKGLNDLRLLDVSSNAMSGLIPSYLFSLPSIQYIGLSHNQFGGSLPSNLTCSSNLSFVDISQNLLVGRLPSCFGLNKTVIASWNCLSGGGARLGRQHPSSYCRKEALAVRPPVVKRDDDQESKIKLGLILGIIGGVVGMVIVIGLLVLVVVRRSRNGRDGDVRDDVSFGKFDRSVADKSSVRSGSVRTIDSRRVPQTMRSAAIGLPPYRVFTLEEIEDATSNFDPLNFVGEGTQGQLYKGWLGDGMMVLVKCVKLKQKNLPQSLVQHMEVLSKLRHLHLVSVLGHCIVTYQDHPSTSGTVFVVLEHIPNGSLQGYLADWKKREMLKWPQRMAITIGVARGIQFLHTGVAPGIFRNNVKIDHVLLDDSLTAKLSNYTIPLPSKVGAESLLNGQEANSENGEKEDIYQLGLILLQIITGKIVTSTRELDELKNQLENNLNGTQAKLRALVDPSVRGTFAYESLRTSAEITVNCLSKDPRNRPSIEDVLWNLQYSSQVQEGWNSSGNLSGQL